MYKMINYTEPQQENHMSTIRTITSRMISKILTDDFVPALLLDNEDSRQQFQKVDISEIDALIFRLEETRDVLQDLQNSKESKARELVEGLIKNSEFSSVAELLAALGGSVPPAPKATKTTAKTYEVVLYDSASDTKRSYNVINRQLPRSLMQDEVYIKFSKKNPEMSVDDFLRQFSPEYAKDFPVNAKWDKNTFHINERGRLNTTSQMYFEQYKKKHPEDSYNEKTFKDEVRNAYSKP